MAKVHFDLKEDIKWHLFGWVALISLELIVSRTLSGQFSGIWYYVCFYALNIAFFYGHAHLLRFWIDRHGKHFVMPIFLLLLELVVYSLLSILLSKGLDLLDQLREMDKDLVKTWVSVMYRGLTFMIYSSLFVSFKNSVYQREQAHQREIENKELSWKMVQVESDFLRAQINPHLLFNTINFIYYTVKHQPDQARLALDKFSSIMHYALKENRKEFVALSEELEQVEQMIDLIKMRYGGVIYLDYQTSNTESDYYIIPLIVLTLVENLFKHGLITNPEQPAFLKIEIDESGFYFFSSNAIANHPQQSGNHTGLRNITERLQRSYSPAQFDLDFGYRNNRFEVELNISN